MSTAIIIPADVNEPIRTEQVNDLEDYQRLVGGWIESAPLDREDISIYVNEEGKMQRLGNNRRASEFWVSNIEEILPGDYLAGDAVIIGFDPETGDSIDVPASVLAQFKL